MDPSRKKKKPDGTAKGKAASGKSARKASTEDAERPVADARPRRPTPRAWKSSKSSATGITHRDALRRLKEVSDQNMVLRRRLQQARAERRQVALELEVLRAERAEIAEMGSRLKAAFEGLESERVALFSRQEEMSRVMAETEMRLGQAAEEAIVIARAHIAGASPGKVDDIWSAVGALLDAGGFEVLVTGVERPGSVWREWAIRRGQKKAKQFAEAVMLAANDTYVRKPGAEATKALADGTARLLEVIADKESVFMFDNIATVQFRGPDGEMRIVSKELTSAERSAVNRDPTLLADARTFLNRLAAEVSDEPDPPVIGGTVVG